MRSAPEQQLDQATATFNALLEKHAGTLEGLRRTVAAEAERARRTAYGNLRNAVAALPMAAVATWDDPVWQGGWAQETSLHPIAVRVGTLNPAGGQAARSDIPALVNLADEHVIVVEENGQPGLERIVAIALRALTCATPGSLEPWFIDARGAGALSAPFAPILDARQRRQECVAIDERGIEDLLTRLASEILAVQSSILRGQFSSLADFFAHRGIASEPRRLLVVNGFPRGFGSQAADVLETVLRSGAASGITVLATVDSTAPVPHGIDLGAVLGAANTFRAQGGGTWSSSALAGCAIRFDSPPPQAVVLTTRDLLAGQATQAADRTVPLAESLPVDAAFWAESSVQGLATVIGRDSKGDDVEWAVSDVGSLWAAFIAGSAGTGKSNLLHVLIAGLAARYSPQELEMYLLDFKQGVEMWQYGPEASPDWLPHVKLVARSTDRELGIDALTRLKAELDARFREYGTLGLAENTYSRYRAHGGRRPRCLIVLDEFQDLLLPADRVGDAAIDILSQLAKLGRAGGFHLVLATQTLNGLSEIKNKLTGILDQHQLRIALRLTPDMSEEVLPGRRDAATLKPKGQALFMRGAGSPDVTKVDISHAEGPTLGRVRAVAARRRSPNATVPFTYDGGAEAGLDQLGVVDPALGRGDSYDGTPIAIVGRPAAMAHRAGVRLSSVPGNHLVLAGEGAESAAGVLQAAAMSVAAQAPEGTVQFLLVEPLKGGVAMYPALRFGLVALGATATTISDGRTLQRQLERLRRIPPSPRPHRRFVIVCPDMANWTHLRIDGSEVESVLATGPSSGIHAMLHFSTLGGADALFGYGFLNDHVHHRVLLDASDDEQLTSSFLAKTVNPRPAGAPRVDLWSRADATRIQRLIPPKPLTEREMRDWLARRQVAAHRAPGQAS